MAFRALVVRKGEDGRVTQAVELLDDAALPDGDVEIDVACSNVNYKDGLCLTGNGGLVRTYPHVPGIDLAGTVTRSDDARYKPGDQVVLTGWRVGEVHWGGYAEKAQVTADWLVPLPAGKTAEWAMAIGTAGLTSMLAVRALEHHGLKPGQGEVLVTGASGGVGSVAVAILSQLGYEVAAVTGRPEGADYLRGLGASRIVAREELAEAIKRPLEAETWAGCIDAVGGEMLARVLGQMKYGASVAAVGLAAGAGFPGTVVPFLLRGVNLLGIDSVMQPYDSRVDAWKCLAAVMPDSKLQTMVSRVGLADLPGLGAAILAGKVRGRVIVDPTA